MNLFFDDRVSITANVIGSIGIFLTLANNVPQLVHTYKNPGMGDFNLPALVLRLVSQLLWILYAVLASRVILLVSSFISAGSTICLLFYKIKDTHRQKYIQH